MPDYRLSYPARIFASVRADTLPEAKQKLASALAAVSEGIGIELDDVAGERLYPDTDETGDVSTSLVELENIEG